MASNKLVVIERIWEMLAAEGKGRMVVHFDDVEAAIIHCNANDGKDRSTSNLANFMKDLIRPDSASRNWPISLATARIGARQRVGQKRSFEFQPYTPGQTEPFPNLYLPAAGTQAHVVQSLSLPLASKALGRKDETWLIQVAVALNVLETHLSLRHGSRVTEIVHLQTGVKLSNTEIDCLFRATLSNGVDSYHVLVTCEAKQAGERILEHQIVEQVTAAYKSVKRSVDEEDLKISSVIPTAIKAIPPNGEIFVVVFKPWSPEEADAGEAAIKDLEEASRGLYRLSPPVSGIGFAPLRRKRSRPRGVETVSI